MRRQLLAVTASLAFMGGLSYVLLARMLDPNTSPGYTIIGDVEMTLPEFAAHCGGFEPALVDVIHSDDKTPWVEVGTSSFMRGCPNIQIRLHAMSDAEAIATIEAGERVPALWLPSDSIFVDHLEERWSSEQPELERGASLLRSPMVLLLWEERERALDVLERGFGAEPSVWADLACAGVARTPDPIWGGSELEPEPSATWLERWHAAHPVPMAMPDQPPLEAIGGWGRIDVRHAMPSRSTGGMLALMLLAHGYAASVLSPHAVAERDDLHDALELLQPALEDWLVHCERDPGEQFDDAEILTERMFQLDAQGFDGVITYEWLALEILGRIATHEETLSRVRMVIPRSTVVSDHPAVFFGVDDARAREGARRLAEFLLDRRMQREAVRRGLRPGDGRERVTVQDREITPNPFLELRRLGIPLELDVREPPRVGREPLLALVEAWEAATGRH